MILDDEEKRDNIFPQHFPDWKLGAIDVDIYGTAYRPSLLSPPHSTGWLPASMVRSRTVVTAELAMGHGPEYTSTGKGVV